MRLKIQHRSVYIAKVNILVILDLQSSCTPKKKFQNFKNDLEIYTD